MKQLDAWLTRWLAKEIDFQICIVICSNKKQSAAYLQALSLSSFAPQRQLAGNLCRTLLNASTGQQEAAAHTDTQLWIIFTLQTLAGLCSNVSLLIVKQVPGSLCSFNAACSFVCGTLELSISKFPQAGSCFSLSEVWVIKFAPKNIPVQKAIMQFTILDCISFVLRSFAVSEEILSSLHESTQQQLKRTSPATWRMRNILLTKWKQYNEKQQQQQQLKNDCYPGAVLITQNGKLSSQKCRSGNTH